LAETEWSVKFSQNNFLPYLPELPEQAALLQKKNGARMPHDQTSFFLILEIFDLSGLLFSNNQAVPWMHLLFQQIRPMKTLQY